jgi:transposase
LGKKTFTAQGYPRVKVICFDKITLHKGHGKYLLVISALELELVLVVLKNRSKERMFAWLTARGKERCECVEVACSDMWEAYQEAAGEKYPMRTA